MLCSDLLVGLMFLFLILVSMVWLIFCNLFCVCVLKCMIELVLWMLILFMCLWIFLVIGFCVCVKMGVVGGGLGRIIEVMFMILVIVVLVLVCVLVVILVVFYDDNYDFV